MVEHGETGRGREPVAFQGQGGGGCLCDLDVRTGEALSQLGREFIVEFHCGQVRNPSSEHVRAQARTGSDLQNIITAGHLSPRTCSFKCSPLPTPRKKQPGSIAAEVAAACAMTPGWIRIVGQRIYLHSRGGHSFLRKRSAIRQRP